MQCPACREELSDKFSFCPYCGTRLQPALCPVCKTRSVPGARFCAYCGSNLSNPSKEESERNVEEERKMQNTAMDSLLVNLMSDNMAEDGEEEEPEFDSSSPDAWELSFLSDFK